MEPAEISTEGFMQHDGSMTFPRWFIWLAGGLVAFFMATFGPWSVWATVVLFDATSTASRVRENTPKIERLMANEQSDRVRDNTARIVSLEANQAALFSSSKVVEATRFTAADGRQLTTGLEQRFDRMDARFDTLAELVKQIQLDMARLKPPPKDGGFSE